LNENKSKNSKLINANTGHFKVLDFINVNLNISLLWNAVDIDQKGQIGVTFNGYDENTNSFVGSITISDVTTHPSEKDITSMSEEELKNYDKKICQSHKKIYNDNLLSWEPYETFITVQNILALTSKHTSHSENDQCKMFHMQMRTMFDDRQLFLSLRVIDKNLNFINYFRPFREVIEKAIFEIYSARYQGDYKNGLYEGKGTLTVGNDIYFGNFKNGKFDGKGSLSINGREVYSGLFEDGKAIERSTDKSSMLEEIKKFFWFCFSYQGRESKGHYLVLFLLAWFIFPSIPILIIEGALYYLPTLNSYIENVNTIFFINSAVTIFCLNPFLIPSSIRRLNDLNCNKYHIFWLFIPGVYFLFHLWTLLSVDSDKPINKYGFSKKLIFPDDLSANMKKGPWEK